MSFKTKITQSITAHFSVFGYSKLMFHRVMTTNCKSGTVLQFWHLATNGLSSVMAGLLSTGVPPSQQAELNLPTEKYGPLGRMMPKLFQLIFQQISFQIVILFFQSVPKLQIKNFEQRRDFHKMNFTATLPRKPVFSIRPNQQLCQICK